jgi:hypothetical protein
MRGIFDGQFIKRGKPGLAAARLGTRDHSFTIARYAMRDKLRLVATEVAVKPARHRLVRVNGTSLLIEHGAVPKVKPSVLVFLPSDIIA